MSQDASCGLALPVSRRISNWGQNDSLTLDANLRRAVVVKSGSLAGIVGDTGIFQSVEERGCGPD